MILLKNAVLLDANHENTPLDVLVDGNLIKTVGTGLSAETEIDLTGYTLLPGFIDAHVHVATTEGLFSDEAVLAWCENGVTSVRELGMLSTLSMEDYAKWIEENNRRPETARVIATGKYIDVAGGYGCGPDPGKVVGTVVKDSVGAQAAVEHTHALGFPGIKIGISDGMPGTARMSGEMIAAIGEKCRELGMFSACHIGLSATLQEMVSGGITEAGHTPNDPMPDSLIAEMAEKGIPMDTTVGDPDKAMEPPPGMDFPGGMPGMPPMGGPGGPGGMPPMGGPGGMDPAKMAQQKKEQHKIMLSNLKRFHDAGGKIVLGTDLIHSRDFKKDATIPTAEMRALASVGIPFMEIIRAGTISAAEVIGTAKEEGTVEAGKLANLIAVKGSVDETFRALEDVAFVMHYGTVVKNNL